MAKIKIYRWYLRLWRRRWRLPNLDDANRMAGVKMQAIVVFVVLSGSETHEPKAGVLPPEVAAEVLAIVRSQPRWTLRGADTEAGD